MIIDNIFSIKTYLGSQPLPLFNPPTELNNNVTYTTFIDNVTTIYGTQSINGVIPVFYKTNNLPDSKSSLKFLEPDQSYYFVSKANAVFPYDIPYSGTISPAPYNNCPSVDIVPQRITLTSASGNYYYFSQDISNLNIGYPYTYSIRSLNSNWKVTPNPASGTIISSKNTNNIMSVIRFDSDAGVTNYSTFLPPGNDPSQIDRNNLFAVMEVALTSPQNIDCPQVIDLITIQCNNCIPAPSPTPTATPTPTPTPAPLFSNNISIVTNNTPISANGITFNASAGDRLDYTAVSPISGGPQTMTLFVASTVVGTVSFPSDYTGRPFRYRRASSNITYSGTFTNGNVNF